MHNAPEDFEVVFESAAGQVVACLAKEAFMDRSALEFIDQTIPTKHANVDVNKSVLDPHFPRARGCLRPVATGRSQEPTEGAGVVDILLAVI